MREGFYGSLTQHGTLLPELQARACRGRLIDLLDVICEQRGWSRLELARALGRRTSVVLSDSQFPTLDFLDTLADEIGWSTPTLATFVLGPDICWSDAGLAASLGGRSHTPHHWPSPHSDRFNHNTSSDTRARTTCVGTDTRPRVDGRNPAFDAADQEAVDAYELGQARTMLRAARRMGANATTPDQHGLACIRELGAWDLLGLYPRALEVTRRGVDTPNLSPPIRACLLTNLAIIHCALWQLTEAVALAARLLHHHATDPIASGRTDHNEAFAFFIRAEAQRRQLVHAGSAEPANARQAECDFAGALARFRALAHADPTNRHHRAMAARSLAGISECRVVTGVRDRDATLAGIVRALERVRSTDARHAGALRAAGWRCVIGCAILMRDPPDDDAARRDRDERTLAILTNKAYEIADRTGDWGLRERVFAIEYNRREANLRHTGVRTDWIMDHEDLGLLAGAMARFPSFRQTGLQIYRAARIVS